MKKNVLLLHIGMPKTGTTALQHFFRKNDELLKEYGWAYPDTKKILDERFPTLNPIMYSPPDFLQTRYVTNGSALFTNWVFDTNSPQWNYLWEYLEKELENRNVILSSEDIYIQDTGKIISEVKKRYSNVKIIVYLRRQDLLADSYWNQLIKGDYSKNFDEYIEECVNAESYGYYYLKKLDVICDLVGKDNLIVRPYEKKQFRGTRNDIFSDFLDAIGLEMDWNRVQEIQGRINERLEGNFFAIKKTLNTLAEFDSGILFEEYRHYFTYISRKLGNRHDQTGGYFRTEKDRIYFLEKFREQNGVIARKYMGNQDGMLFYDNDTDIPYIEEIEIPEFEQDLIKVFGMILCNEARLIKKRVYFLERENTKLKEACKRNIEIMLMLQKRGRKIAFFGAGYRCRKLLEMYGFEIKLIIDNDKKKRNEMVNGIPVVNTEDITNWRELLVIITCAEAEEVERQLEGIGLQKWEDYLLAADMLPLD